MVICCKVKQNKQKDFHAFRPWELNGTSTIVSLSIYLKKYIVLELEL